MAKKKVSLEPKIKGASLIAGFASSPDGEFAVTVRIEGTGFTSADAAYNYVTRVLALSERK